MGRSDLERDDRRRRFTLSWKVEAQVTLPPRRPRRGPPPVPSWVRRMGRVVWGVLGAAATLSGAIELLAMLADAGGP